MLDNAGKKIKHQTKKQLRKVARLIKNKPKNIGLAPGSLVYVGDKEKNPITISLFDYKAEHFEEKTISNLDELLNYKVSDTISWINVDGVHDVQILESIGKLFDIHPLTLEDILNTNQRPKVDEYSNYLYIVLRMFFMEEKDNSLKNEQVSFILTKNYLITFLEDAGDVFDPVRERLRKSATKMRESGTDYLAYALIDSIVDSYFHILEKKGEEIEGLEDSVVLNPDKNDIQTIHLLRREMILLRRAIWPLREVISSLQRNEIEFFDEKIRVYLRDVYDHTIQVIDTIESYRDMIVGMLDTYLSSTSNKLNEVMKVLTVISTMFIPLTFIAGVFGMNFKNFPELGLEWMYPWGFWAFTILIIAGMTLFFKHKKWF
ncbi:MAG: magnesium/cobalt transporter CorA [Ignavibacterium sp.]|jgi:magnesium transporter|nr:magnesium/cobalt transporter CorA [Ignavibacterium sp.]